MTTFDNCALLIGVNDYRTFDQSTGARPGTSDLLGSRNDVVSFYRVCRQMGIAPENLRVLTSPKLTPDDLEGLDAASIREATEAEILDGVAWLADRIGGEDPLPGLFTYSGHGDWKEGVGLVICPSDTAGPNLDHAVPLAKIQALFAERRALKSLTVVLDCCHSGGARGARKAMSLTGRPVPPALAAGLASLGERVLSAAAVTGTSYQSRFAGVHHGAFSWALSSAMDQWTARAEGSSVELSVSYGDLMARARGLLATLSFEQAPVLKGPPAVEQMAFFHRGRGGREGTETAPDRKRRGGQLNPDLRYFLSFVNNGPSMSWSINVSPGQHAARSEQALDYPTNTELWGLDDAFLSALSTSRSLSLGAAGVYQAPSTAPPVQMPAESLWTPAPAPNGNVFIGANKLGQQVGLAFDLTSGRTWAGTVTWYVGVSSGDPPEYVIGDETVSMSYDTAVDSSLTWYQMTLPPLSWATESSNRYAQTNSGSALAQMNGALCGAYIAQNTPVLFMLPEDGGAVSTYSMQVGDASPHALPTLAPLGEVFYVAYTSIYNRVNVYGALLTGSGFSPYLSLFNVAWTSASPALAAYDSRLCLAYLSGASTMEMMVWDGQSWISAGGPGSAAAGGPALASFSSSLFLAFVGANLTTIEIYQITSADISGKSWPKTPSAVIQIDTEAQTATCDPGAAAPSSPLTFYTVNLAVYHGLLFLSFTDTSSHVWICSSADGVSWSGFSLLSNQLPGVTSNTNAPICAFGADSDTLALAYTVVEEGSTSTYDLYVITAT